MSLENPVGPRILFRADGNAEIGSGHLRRCLALAEQLSIGGAHCLFVCRASPDSFNYLVTQSGFELIQLEYEGDVAEQDAQETLSKIQHDQFYAVIVDHYQLEGSWEALLRTVAPLIVAIDDLANRKHDVDILIDVLPGDECRYNTLVPGSCRKLLGPQYALLRSEFGQLRLSRRERSGVVDRLLISFGGVDPDNLTKLAVNAVRAILPNVPIDIVLTGISPNRAALEALYRDDPHLFVHIDTNNMSELMASASLAIGAGGSTSWERACLGLPSIIAVLADNQLATARALEQAGCAIAVPAGINFEYEVRQLVQFLSNQPTLLRLMAAAGAALVDGRGLSRLAAAITPSAVTVRPVLNSEAHKIWEWRNSPDIRATAIDNHEISWDEHRLWFERRIADATSVMLVGSERDKEVGFVRFDLDGSTATVSIFVAPGENGRGIGRELLRAGEQWCLVHHPQIDRFFANVRPENTASIALFVGTHYTPVLYSYERKYDG